METTRLYNSCLVVNRSLQKSGEGSEWLGVMCCLNISKERRRFHIYLFIIYSGELQGHLLSLHLLLRHNGARSLLYKMSVKH